MSSQQTPEPAWLPEVLAEIERLKGARNAPCAATIAEAKRQVAAVRPGASQPSIEPWVTGNGEVGIILRWGQNWIGVCPGGGGVFEAGWPG